MPKSSRIKKFPVLTIGAVMPSHPRRSSFGKDETIDSTTVLFTGERERNGLGPAWHRKGLSGFEGHRHVSLTFAPTARGQPVCPTNIHFVSVTGSFTVAITVRFA